MNKILSYPTEHEPVVSAGVVRAIVYSLLGTRVDAGTLALIVLIAEALTGFLVRRVVSARRRDGVAPQGPKPSGAPAQTATVARLADLADAA